MQNKIRIIPNFNEFQKIDCEEIKLKGKEKKDLLKLKFYQKIEQNTIEFIDNYFEGNVKRNKVQISKKENIKDIQLINSMSKFIDENKIVKINISNLNYDHDFLVNFLNILNKKYNDKIIYLYEDKNQILKTYESLKNLDLIKNLDFKIIAEQHELKWKDIYITTLWFYFNDSGKMMFNDKPIKFNEYDIATLIIASRYLGKVTWLFNTKTNYNSEFFSPLTLAFFHGIKYSKQTFEEFISNIRIDRKDIKDKLKDLLFTKEGYMKFDMDHFINMSQNLSVLKHLNFEIFLKGLIGRNILDTYPELFTDVEKNKYRSIFSQLDHSVDFVIVSLITRDKKEFLSIFDEVYKKYEEKIKNKK